MSRAIIALYVALWLAAVTCWAALASRPATAQRAGCVPPADTLARTFHRRYGVGLAVGRLRLAVRLEVGVMV